MDQKQQEPNAWGVLELCGNVKAYEAQKGQTWDLKGLTTVLLAKVHKELLQIFPTESLQGHQYVPLNLNTEVVGTVQVGHSAGVAGLAK